MNIETFLTRERALSDRLLEAIQKDTEVAPIIVLRSLMTLTARTCVALELTPAEAVDGFVLALKDAHNSKPEQGPLQ